MFCHNFDSPYPLLFCDYFLRRVDPSLNSVACSVGVNTLQGCGLRDWHMLIYPTIVVSVLAAFSHNRPLYQEWVCCPLRGNLVSLRTK